MIKKKKSLNEKIYTFLQYTSCHIYIYAMVSCIRNHKSVYYRFGFFRETEYAADRRKKRFILDTTGAVRDKVRAEIN